MSHRTAVPCPHCISVSYNFSISMSRPRERLEHLGNQKASSNPFLIDLTYDINTLILQVRPGYISQRFLQRANNRLSSLNTIYHKQEAARWGALSNFDVLIR